MFATWTSYISVIYKITWTAQRSAPTYLVGAMVTIAPRRGMRRGPFMALRQRRNRWRSSQLGRYSILKYKPDSKFVHKYKAFCVESGPNHFNFTLFFGSFPTERRACSHVEEGAWKKANYFNLYLLVKRVKFSPYLLVWSVWFGPLVSLIGGP